MKNPTYEKLEQRLAEIADLGQVASLIGWDQHVMMPQGGAALRANQRSTLTRVLYELFTSAETGRLLDELSDYEQTLDPDSDEAATIRQAVASVSSQVDHVLVVANDCSDDTAALLQFVTDGGRLVIGGRFPSYLSGLRDNPPQWSANGSTAWTANHPAAGAAGTVAESKRRTITLSASTVTRVASSVRTKKPRSPAAYSESVRITRPVPSIE